MRSSAGAYNAELRAPLWLGSVALTALVLALAIAFITIIPRPKPRAVQTSQTTTVAPAQQATAAAASAAAPQNRPVSLWSVLLPWAIGLDVAALLGLILVLVVRSNVRVTLGGRR